MSSSKLPSTPPVKSLNDSPRGFLLFLPGKKIHKHGGEQPDGEREREIPVVSSQLFEFMIVLGLRLNDNIITLYIYMYILSLE